MLPDGDSTDERLAFLFGGVVLPEELNSTDFEIAVRLLRRHWQVLPMAEPLLRQAAPRDGSGSHSLEQLTQERTVLSVLSRYQETALTQVLGALNHRDIIPVLLKGSATRLFHFRPGERASSDWDIGVNPNRIQEARDSLKNIGLVSSYIDTAARKYYPIDAEREAEAERGHYQLCMLVHSEAASDLSGEERAAILAVGPKYMPMVEIRNEDIYLHSEFDLHHKLSQQINLDLVEDGRRVECLWLGKRVCTPVSSSLLFHFIFKLYWEGVQRYGHGIHQFADIIKVVTRTEPSDFEPLGEALAKWNLRAGGFYVLRRLALSFGQNVSQELNAVIEACRDPDPNKSALDQNDLGDMWPRIWGTR